ncbi:MAG: hypothetical protein AAGM67_13295, partial [Bacteroidota bacterium]
LAPDGVTSILPEQTKLVLHANPETMSFSYSKIIQRIQTDGGYVEQHWGEGTETINFNGTTGGFVRLYAGLVNITGGGVDAGGTRRETIAYDKYLDFLALFHQNGGIYDTNGSIIFQGQIKISFDGQSHFGWFSNFSVSENVDKPYQFALSATFTVERDLWELRSTVSQSSDITSGASDQVLSPQGFDPFDLITF